MIETAAPALKSEVLTTGPPGKPLFVLKTCRMKGMESPSLGDWVDSMAYCMGNCPVQLLAYGRHPVNLASLPKDREG